MSRESYESTAMNTRAACHDDDTPVSLSPDQPRLTPHTRQPTIFKIRPE